MTNYRLARTLSEIIDQALLDLERQEPEHDNLETAPTRLWIRAITRTDPVHPASRAIESIESEWLLR